MITEFIEYLKSIYDCDFYENNERHSINIYTLIDYKFHEQIPNKFKSLEIEYMYPEIIMTNGENYIVRQSEYNPEIEFFTIFIKK